MIPRHPVPRHLQAPGTGQENIKLLYRVAVIDVVAAENDELDIVVGIDKIDRLVQPCPGGVIGLQPVRARHADLRIGDECKVKHG